MIKKLFFTFFIIIVLLLSLAMGALFYISQQPWVDFSVLENYNPGKPSILLDDEGHEWGRFQLDRRKIIQIRNIPPHVINAFITAEDRNFFQHAGLSIKGIIRSIIVNLYQWRRAQGASTITQQLVRLLFFDTKKSFYRKFKEQALSLIVEQQFTKEQILETYLNHVYLGSGIYGVEAASQRFWEKPVTELSLDQAAVLASIVQLPAKLSPLHYPNLTLKRRNYILKSMCQLGFITKKERDEALEKPIHIITQDIQNYAPHLKETLRLFLEETIGKQKLYSGGLKIQTTINLEMQKTAEKVFYEQLSTYRKKINSELEGALIAIDGRTGAIKALIGGSNFVSSQFNRALKARRQMGSIIKPLVYTQALIAGKSFSEIGADDPLTLVTNGKEWSPQNSYHFFEGPITLARALAVSNNIITIKLLLELGPEKIINLAQSCGLTGPFHVYPSLALGCIESSPEEAAAMINVFAHHGTYVKPYTLSWIKDEWGTKIWKHKEHKKMVIDSKITSQVAKILTHKIERLKAANPEQWFTFDALGKTGTTNDARTCWFVGANPDITTAVYIGCDDNKPLGKKVYASQTVLPLWREFNKRIGSKHKNFAYDPSLKEIIIDSKTGILCAPDDIHAIKILVDSVSDISN